MSVTLSPDIDSTVYGICHGQNTVELSWARLRPWKGNVPEGSVN